MGCFRQPCNGVRRASRLRFVNQQIEIQRHLDLDLPDLPHLNTSRRVRSGSYYGWLWLVVPWGGYTTATTHPHNLLPIGRVEDA